MNLSSFAPPYILVFVVLLLLVRFVSVYIYCIWVYESLQVGVRLLFLFRLEREV